MCEWVFSTAFASLVQCGGQRHQTEQPQQEVWLDLSEVQLFLCILGAIMVRKLCHRRSDIFGPAGFGCPGREG